jgi:transcriptional regulator with XRE-family HTH domain
MQYGPISSRLRHCIKTAPVTRYRISQETGISQSVLSRFMSGKRSIDVETADRLAACLGLVLVSRSSPLAKKTER